MAKASPNAALVGRYAKALLQLATKHNQADGIRDELKGLGEVLQASPTFKSLIADPGVSEGVRQTLLSKAFGGGRVSPVMMNFLGLLNSKNRLNLLPEVIDAYQDLLDAQRGIIEVDVTVAHRLTPEQLETVRDRVSTALKRNAVVHQYVDESIIGGLVLRVEDKLIDASVRNQLETMRRQLLQATPKRLPLTLNSEL
jgi:F-type H+-transporting ATPase subunit delta